MKVLVINGSPRKKGVVSTLLRAVVEGMNDRATVEWVDVYSLSVKLCAACMKCRPDGSCVMPEDGAHVIAGKISEADALVVGSPTHWGNMSSGLKTLFDRIVPAVMGEKPNGIPIPRHRGKTAVIVSACTTPWPFNWLLPESRGAVRAIREVLHYGGFSIAGIVVKPGTKKNPDISPRTMIKAKKAGLRLMNKTEGRKG
jgi:NAD(P)H-dependent FMN reductase